jgi:hypothetical protein
VRIENAKEKACGLKETVDRPNRKYGEKKDGGINSPL